MFKRSMLLGVVSGIFAGIASVVYARTYNSSLGSDFSSVVKPANLFIASILGCILAAIGYTLLTKWLKGKGEIVFNLLFTILTIASILGPLAAKLPLTIEMPELFPGFAIPMHFFPALGWFTLKPLFIKSYGSNK